MRAPSKEEDLSVASRVEGGSTVVTVAGEVDAYTAPYLRARLVEIIAEGTTSLVLDLRQVSFLDSTALGVLVGAQRRVRALDGSILIVSDRSFVTKLFHITGLDRVMTLYETPEQALEAQRRGHS